MCVCVCVCVYGQVIDYVKECAKVVEIDRDAKTWRRKVEIAEVCSLFIVLWLC